MAMEVLEGLLPAQAAAGATTTTMIGDLPSAEATPSYTIGKLSLTSPSLVTGQATNFATITFRQMRAGASVQTLGSYVLNVGTVTLPAETETNVPVTGTLAVLAGDTIDVQCVQTGTGLALPAGILAKAEVS